jgi:two-component system chemotaxis sensor kinase CheA
MDLSDALQTFVAESRAMLADMEAGLLRLEESPGDEEAVHAVFRAAHTVKGSAGIFGLDSIVEFAHRVETVLVRVREGTFPMDGALASLLLECCDHLGRLVDTQEHGSALDACDHAAGQALAGRLLAYQDAPGEAGGTDAAARGQRGGATRRGATDGAAGADGDETADVWHISLRFSPGVLADGFDPASFIRHLATLGDIVHLTTVADSLPPLAELDPHQCHLGFEIRLRSGASKAQIEAVFSFVREDCQLRMLPPDSRVADYVRLIDDLPESRLRLGELLVAAGAVTQHELEETLRKQHEQRERHVPLGQVLVEERITKPEVVDAALNKQTDARQRQAQESKLIRVHADKLDALINLVGELVIAGAAVGTLAQRNRDRALLEAVSAMARLTEEVRGGSMRLRMVEIGETFARFRRVVRDVSKELGKEIDLVVTGGDTELDKSLVERISDPLTHLVRNAIDHGIESPAERSALGKPATGRVELKAFHEAGAIVIEVSDDGKGLDRERILAKARAKGLVSPEAVLGDADVWNLVFEPGFSTVETVSNLSGRGVGMDVVRRSVEALRGSLEIQTQAGRGTTFRIRLPLTLAIIDGFLLGVGEGHFVVPLDMVIECLRMDDVAQAQRDYIDLRGEVLPLLRLREHLGLEGNSARRQSVVVVRTGARRAGLVVDALKGEIQAVIKPLGRLLDGLPGISGSTILGSGEVALMLDVPELLGQAQRRDLEVHAAGARVNHERT